MKTIDEQMDEVAEKIGADSDVYKTLAWLGKNRTRIVTYLMNYGEYENSKVAVTQEMLDQRELEERKRQDERMRWIRSDASKKAWRTRKRREREYLKQWDGMTHSRPHSSQDGKK